MDVITNMISGEPVCQWVQTLEKHRRAQIDVDTCINFVLNMDIIITMMETCVSHGNPD